MFDNLHYILQHNCRIELNKPVLLGVSGGPDSLCLLDLLWRLGYPVLVAHQNHGLRATADIDAQVVRQEAESRQLPFFYLESNVIEYSENYQISIEEAARVVRYHFLFEQARASGAQVVMVAHTADDQVETVLMHLLRGTGLEGLVGMPYRAVPNSWDDEIPLVRPLLGYWRVDIQTYLDSRDIHPVQDESNLDTSYLRNRIRHETISYLENINPQIKPAITRMTGILRGEQEIIEIAENTAWEECCVNEGKGYVGFAVESLTRKPLGLQRHVIRRGIAHVQDGSRDIDYDAIERALQLLKSSTGGKVDLFADLYAVKEYQRIWLANKNTELPTSDWLQLSPGEQYYLDIPDVRYLQEHWAFFAEIVDTPDPRCYAGNSDPFQAWVDADRISSPIELRGRKPGDCFQPLGLGGGSIKVTDFMIDHKIPQRVRDRLPLVVSGGEIVWIPGYRLAEGFRITSKTKRAIHFKVKRVEKHG